VVVLGRNASLLERERGAYRLAFRVANKAITTGPDSIIRAKTVSCATMLRFIDSSQFS
jgi:hypothetical protein